MAIRPTRSLASRSRSWPRQIVQMRSPIFLPVSLEVKPLKYETLRVRRDGQVIPVSLAILPLSDLSGAIIGASTIARDITVQKQAEAEVERRRRETEMLADLAQSLSASLDLDTVLQRVVAGAQELCASERAILMLRDPTLTS